MFPVLAALYFYEVLSGEYLLVERDLAEFFIPPRLFWIAAVKNHSFPFWNPYFFSGHPLFATLQPGVLYPFSIFYLFRPFAQVFNHTIILHFALAGIFTYLLMRAANASRTASLIGGICFMLSGYLLSVHSLLSTLLSVVWTPLFFLCYLTAFVRRSVAWAVIAGIVGTVMFLGGGVETCYLNFGLAFVLSLFPGILFDPAQYPALKTRLFYFMAFAAVFLGLAAIQLLPFVELSRLSIRATGLSYSEATIWSLAPADLVGFLVPDLYGYWEKPDIYWTEQNWLKTIYTGSLPFLLTLFFISRGERMARGFIMISLAALVLAFGKHSLFYPYLYKYLPFLGKLRFPVKFLFLPVFLLSLAAGFGYDRFDKGLAENPRRALQLAKIIFAAGFTAMVLFGLLSAYDEAITAFCRRQGWVWPEYNEVDVNLFNAQRLCGFTGLFALAIFIHARQAAARPYTRFAIVLLLAADLFFIHRGFYHRTKTEDYLKPGSNMSFIIADRSMFRILITKRTFADRDDIVLPVKVEENINKEKIMAGWGLAAKIFDGRGADVMPIDRYKHIIDLASSAPAADATRLFDLLNVKYVVSIPRIKSPDFKLAHVNVPGDMTALEDKKTIKIYENLHVLPRAFLAGACQVVKSEAEYVRIYSSREFQPDKVILLNEAPLNFPCTGNAIGAGFKPARIETGEYARFTRYENNFVDLEVKTGARKFLFMSENWYPGWAATVDGVSAPILRADYTFRAILVAPGTHRVHLEYRPLSFKIGAGITAVTVIVCGVFLIIRVYRCSSVVKTNHDQTHRTGF